MLVTNLSSTVQIHGQVVDIGVTIMRTLEDFKHKAVPYLSHHRFCPYSRGFIVFPYGAKRTKMTD